MTTIELKFDLGQKVKVIGAHLTGVVTSVQKHLNGMTYYKVQYWDTNHVRHEPFLYEFEIRAEA